MAEGKKSGLDELRKSFPSLDGHSARTLLGGGGEIPGPFIGWNEDGSPVYGDPFPPPQPPPGGNSESGGPLSTSTVSTGGSSGSDYFGDWDDDYGDFGWGEGWGDYDGGTDSNPDGSEGGNGQNSSGNPGGEQTTNDYGALTWENIALMSDFAHRTVNHTPLTMYCKDEFSGDRFEVPPGGFTDLPIDAFKLNGHVYKVVGGYGTLIVNGVSYTTFNTNPVKIAEQTYFNLFHGNPCERDDFDAGDHQWDDIFHQP